MSSGDDWQVGDLAMVIRVEALGPGGWVCHQGKGVKSGMVFTVASVLRSPVWTALGFNDFKSSWCNGEWDSRSFRKIKPLSDEESESFLADLREPVEA